MKTDFTLRFSPEALRRLAAGAKRATVLRATQASMLEAGQMIVATTTGSPVQVPLRVVELHPLPHLGALPVAAKAAGLALADFTTLPDWSTYQRVTARTVPGAAALLMLAPDGPVVGTIPDKAIRVRQNADSVNGRIWHRVNDTLPISPDDQVHDADRAELKTRLATAIRARQPDLDTVRMLAPVTDALLHSGRCGPSALGKQHRRRLGDQIAPALDWLTAHDQLAGEAPDRTWSRNLLAGLRINQADRREGQQEHSP